MAWSVQGLDRDSLSNLETLTMRWGFGDRLTICASNDGELSKFFQLEWGVNSRLKDNRQLSVTLQFRRYLRRDPNG